MRIIKEDLDLLVEPLAEDPDFQAIEADTYEVLTLWRLAYDMPITDPRVQEATEEEIILDLAVRKLHQYRLEEAQDPDTARQRRTLKDETKRKKLSEQYEAMRLAPLPDSVAAGLAKLGILPRQKPQPAKPRKGIDP